LFDIRGRHLQRLFEKQEIAVSGTTALDLSRYPTGTYFVRLATPGQTVRRSVIHIGSH
jgi:hypothetical protein